MSGPTGLTVDRATGVVTWRPALSDVGVPYEVTVRALKTEAGDPDQTWYTFTLTASVGHRGPAPGSATSLRPASGGLRDANGAFTGLTTRLPGTGVAVPDLDPNLRLDTAAGVLALSTTRADFNGAAGLAGEQQPGRGAGRSRVHGKRGLRGDGGLPAARRACEFIDQVGVYVGASSARAHARGHDRLRRARALLRALARTASDHGGRFFGFGFDGSDGMTVTITREAGAWRYSIDGVEWNPPAPPAFLDGRSGPDRRSLRDHAAERHASRRIELDSFSLVVAHLGAAALAPALTSAVIRLMNAASSAM